VIKLEEEIQKIVEQLELKETEEETEEKIRKKRISSLATPKLKTIEVPVIITEFLRKKFRRILRKCLQESRKIDYPQHVWKDWCKYKPDDRFYNAWLKIWANAILAHASQKRTFILILPEIAKEPPFTSNGTRLDENYLIAAADILVKHNKAKWLDSNKKTLLVWWIDKKTIAEEIVKIIKELQLNIITMNDLIDAGIPEEIIPEIISELEHITKIRLISRGNRIIGIKFEEIL